MVRVVVAGHVNWDVTLRVDRLPDPDDEARIQGRFRGVGGSAANVASALADLGVAVEVVGSVGTDELAVDAHAALANRGVDTDGLRHVGGDTTIKYLLVADNGAVAVLGNEGVNEALGPDDIEADRITEATHLHVTNHRPETLAALTRVATEADVSISVDLGRRAADREFSASLERADIVFGCARELGALFGTPEGGVRTDRTVVCTEGEAGARVLTDTGEYTVTGHEVDVVDTSGAGDAFAAGYLRAYLGGATHERALTVGNACGALATTNHGAQTTLEIDAVGNLLGDRDPF